MSQKFSIKPQREEILQTKLDFRKNLEGHTGIIVPDEHLENSTNLRLSSSVATVGNENNASISAIYLNDHAINFTKSKQVAVFRFLSARRRGID